MEFILSERVMQKSSTPIPLKKKKKEREKKIKIREEMKKFL